MGFGPTLERPQAQAFTYDLAGRLRTAAMPGIGTFQHSYDPWGNMTASLLAHGSEPECVPGGFFGWSQFTGRQYLRGQDGATESIPTNRTSTLGSTCYPTATIAHDNAGRVLQDETSQYAWDAQDRLLRRTRLDGGPTEKYAYDASGYRAGIAHGSGDRTIEFRGPDGELWRSFKTLGNSVLQIECDHVRSGARLVAVKEHPGGVVWHHADHLGSTRATTLHDGSRRDRFEYSPFGLDLPQGGVLPAADRAFATHERDGDGTLDYMIARWMSPTGRMLTVDELFDVAVEEPITWNAYPYCRSNGLSLIDPDVRAVRGKAVAWVVRLLKERKMYGRAIDSEKEAARLVNQGHVLVAANRSTARRIGRAADGGRCKPVRDKAHPDRRGSTRARDPHYHLGGRPPGTGHIFWSAVSIVAASHWTEGRGPVTATVGPAIDIFNPLALAQDAAEITQAVTDPELWGPFEPINADEDEDGDDDDGSAGECPVPIVQEPTDQ